MANYYYYIAGMSDLNLSNPKAAPDMEELKSELAEHLTRNNLKLVELLDERLEPEEDGSIDKTKAENFFAVRMKCHNKFVREWTMFNLDINNILTAMICRKNGWSIKDNMVGKNEVTEAIIANQSAKDFALREEYPYFDSLMQIVETDNLMEREQKIDALKWQWLDDNTLFNYFSVERVLVQFLRAQMLNRWNILTAEEGERVFREIIDNLKRDVKF